MDPPGRRGGCCSIRGCRMVSGAVERRGGACVPGCPRSERRRGRAQRVEPVVGAREYGRASHAVDDGKAWIHDDFHRRRLRYLVHRRCMGTLIRLQSKLHRPQ